MQSIRIRQVFSNDLEKLAEISRKTFVETFGEYNSEENMNKYLDEKFSREQLALELRNTDSEFFFAMHDDQVIGYLKLNSGLSQTELKDLEAMELERIYVRKDFLGKKVGHLLFEKALDVARQNKAAYLWLGVWEKNERAIAFYRKNGFEPFDRHIFRLGEDDQTDIMMKLWLKN